LGTENTEMRQVIDPMDSAISSTRANVVFHPISPTNKLYDFLYKDSSGHFHVFQATVGIKHSANANAIQKLEVKAGGASKVKFYFLVPSSTFPKFFTEPVDPKPHGSFTNIFHVSIPNPTDEQSWATAGALRQLYTIADHQAIWFLKIQEDHCSVFAGNAWRRFPSYIV